MLSPGALGHLLVTLERPPGDRASPIHQALLRHLAFTSSEGREARLTNGAGPLELAGDPHSITVSLGVSALGSLASLPPLSPFETRYLADNGHPHPAPPTSALALAPLTDLHTHFAGCVGPDQLLDIGLAIGARYSPALLAEAGIHVAAARPVGLDELSPALQGHLAERLAIPLDRQVTFLDLERVYRLRSPITKHPAALVPMCRALARDYASFGVRHVELSLGQVLEASVLRALHEAIPAIEQETGVTLRFLAAFSRHDDVEWDLDGLDRLMALGPCPLVAGVDFMGHETNSTRAFAGLITAVSAWAGRARPGFVVRVHAGENPAYPENVRVAVEAAAGHDVTLRIGHGLHGVDERTLSAMLEAKAIVELNLTSNLALNNLQSAAAVPLRVYLDRGVDVVLGTDGYGIYRTTPALEARAARLAGLRDDDLERLRDAERRYLACRAEVEARAPSIARYQIPGDAPGAHYTPAVAEARRLAREARDLALTTRLASIGVPLLDPVASRALLRGRRALSFAGAWQNSFARLTEADRRLLAEVVIQLVDGLIPTEVVVITGGTSFGVENLVQERARARGLVTLAALVNETPPDSLAEGAFTHARLVGERLYDKAAGLYALVREHGGVALFLGGGPIVSDEIQAAQNLGLDYWLLDGPAGASTLHAREQPGRAFRSAAEVLARLRTPRRPAPAPFFFLGPNPTADAIVTREIDGAREVLLIRRADGAPAEPGRWALPGGFVDSSSRPGEPFAEGREAPFQTALRELSEEAGLDLRAAGLSPRVVGVYEGGGRDPRDTKEAWSRSTAFLIELPDDLARLPIAGGDDADDAAWFPFAELPEALAFDHRRILDDARAILAARR